MHLEIVSPEKKVYEGEVKLVKVPGSKGSFEILMNHAPIISTLDKGEVKVVDTTGKETFFSIEGGIIEVSHNKISLLAENI